MFTRLFRGISLAAVFIGGVLIAGAANAQDFAGKTISIYVGTGPGTTYDRYARLLADYMGRHLPGKPKIVVKNMPGAGGTKLAGYLANVAPQDGTALGLLHQNLPLAQILTPKKAKFDMAAFHWLGSITPISSVIAVWHEAPVKTVEDAKKVELFMGTTGRGSETYQVPAVMNNLLGTKFKIVTGYKALSEMDKAIEQGELHGRGGSILSWTARQPEWVADGKIVFLAQIGLKKMKEWPDVPLLIDLAENDADRKVLELQSSAGAIGRALAAPPGVNAATQKVLRDAFAATMKDKAFVAATEKQGLTVDPSSAEVVQGIVEKTVRIPEALAATFRKAVGF